MFTDDHVPAQVATQNCDNLHAKAGTARDKLCRLHGCVFVEYCEDCEAYVAGFSLPR